MDKEASCDRRGASTLSDLFCWADKASATLRMTPKLRRTLAKLLARPVVLYSDHSGTGNGEEGFLDVMEKFKVNSDAATFPGSPLAWSCCDLDEHAQKALGATSRCKHLFRCIEDMMGVGMDGVLKMAEKKLPRKDDTPRSRRRKVEAFAESVSSQRSSFFPPDRTAYCLWCDQRVPVKAPLASAREDALSILVSGTACQDYSSMNKSALKENGKSRVVFEIWKQNVREMSYDIVFHENVMRFKPQLLREAFGDQCLACIQPKPLPLPDLNCQLS